jgi:hypothetical protein
MLYIPEPVVPSESLVIPRENGRYARGLDDEIE